ncbi:hypothetical protein J2Z69_003522 [Paenibacillus shirakamiensis]|uniref:DUF5302 domain-containing protein n=1 Tax=Paenibacillus shirakamiensis TaxID=1265935 RepID=A0ABS4JL56_9BACL|nr:hypothetical protein [Paenibacillus shirakamiensis]MBP2002449.1 hypothetical protein [Paenibacillus shirakamiensis]
MSEQQEPKKIDLAEAMRLKLQQKKQNQATGKVGGEATHTTKALRSQNHKKPNNQRRRTGGS